MGIKIPRARSRGEEEFFLFCRIHRLKAAREFVFCEGRNWRADFAFVDEKLLVEIEGGVFGKKKSRHTTGAGFQEDCKKYNAAAVLGYRVLRFTTKMVASGEAIQTVLDCLGIENAFKTIKGQKKNKAAK